MEAIQPIRPPLSQQPPQRIDSDRGTSTDNKRINENKENNASSSQRQDTDIPDVDISMAYKRKSLKHRIECGINVKIGDAEINELKLILGPRKCQMYSPNNSMSSCVVCDEQCINGHFGVETVLFIPNKNDQKYDNLGRFRIELPRISCNECSNEYANENNIDLSLMNRNNTNDQLSLGAVWKNYQNGELSKVSNNNNNNNVGDNKPNFNQNNISNTILSTNGDDEKLEISQQDNNSNNNNNNNNNNSSVCNINKSTLPLSEADRDPFDDGFLICTQLVKTGGADQGGLQVGDVFVEFGHYSKKRFPGLKSIANLVRRSAGKEINVVVWRKLEQMNGVEDDGTGRTVFQKLALKLKPLQSHDADGGGVLGAVINTYPLPEMKN